MQAKYKAELLLLLVTFIWGATFGIIKEAFNDVSPFLYNVIRFFLAACIYFLLFRRHLIAVPKPVIQAGITTGIFLGIAYNAQNLGLFYTSASNSAFITGLSVLFVPVLSVMIERYLPRWNVLLGVLCAVIGLRLLTHADASGGFNTGDGITVICALFFALYIIHVEIQTKQYPFIPLVFYQIFTTGCISIPCTLFFEEPYFNFTGDVAVALLITVLFSTIFGFYIQNRVQKNTTATHAALIITAEPIFAALVAVGFYGEYFDNIKIAGAACIIIGMLIAEFRRNNS